MKAISACGPHRLDRYPAGLRAGLDIGVSGSGTQQAMDPEYAKLMGLTATQGKSAMPGPLDVLAKIWSHLKEPFYDKGPNDKGIGIQLALFHWPGADRLLPRHSRGAAAGFLIGMSR